MSIIVEDVGKLNGEVEEDKMEKKKTNPVTLFYDVYLFSMMISINLFFFVFVHYKYDYSPNFALFITTLPIIIVQFIKIINQIKND